MINPIINLFTQNVPAIKSSTDIPQNKNEDSMYEYSNKSTDESQTKGIDDIDKNISDAIDAEQEAQENESETGLSRLHKKHKDLLKKRNELEQKDIEISKKQRQLNCEK